MRLYHFTSHRHLPSILEHGLIKGLFPLMFDENIVFLRHCQWLTKNSSFHQPWHDPEFSKLPFDRRENRITIKIPKEEFSVLMDWDAMERNFKNLFVQDFDYFDDKKNWFVFLGRVSPEWFVKVDRMDGKE